jgi:hypothetical protein
MLDRADDEVARLIAVPPAVNTISFSPAPSTAATRARAASTAARASRPSRCSSDGLPYCSEKYGSIASSTCWSTGVVAAWSK